MTPFGTQLASTDMAEDHHSEADMVFTYNMKHPFPRLPTKLRMRIWLLSLPNTRTVSIRCDTSHSTWGTSPAKVPAILHACRESRQEAIRFYGNLKFGIAGVPKIYFNPEVDVLHFGPLKGFMAASAQYFTAMSLCDASDLMDVRYLAIDDSVFGNGLDRGFVSELVTRTIRQLPRRMPGLKGIVFVRSKAVSVFRETENYCRDLQALIGAAIREVADEFPDWNVPSWCTATTCTEEDRQ
ncbi:hypothetical protein CPAR01_12053 [Colletotrichum paranaense]|uniref:2EXR domain-containing protein n=1 Tax=Colletotrichum paranaense TaxID=1914294 RepID=A0ABQ9S8Y4_9PEZI|nr:uncharacterized protein CPAR01_12053 [Colletotrichum paranaense]KAK1529741.1 hypothetical protein CPAR01_12053 [Colletotrichum paranaense]